MHRVTSCDGPGMNQLPHAMLPFPPWEPKQKKIELVIEILHHLVYTYTIYLYGLYYQNSFTFGIWDCFRSCRISNINRRVRVSARWEVAAKRNYCPMAIPSLNPKPVLLMIEILHDPIYTILPQCLGFWYIKSCKIYIINRSLPSQTSATRDEP